MNRTARVLSVALVVVTAFGSVALAQGMLQTAAQALPGAGAVSPATDKSDPLGRETPAGTVMGFLTAGARADWARAARYLDTKASEERAETLAQELKVLLDRGLTVNLDRLSRKPEGEQDERAGANRESIGDGRVRRRQARYRPGAGALRRPAAHLAVLLRDAA